MESPLGPSLANAFLAHHDQYWLDSCPLEYRPYIIDGTLMIYLLFKSSHPLKRFQSYSNSCHVNTSYTIETEQNNKI